VAERCIQARSICTRQGFPKPLRAGRGHKAAERGGPDLGPILPRVRSGEEAGKIRRDRGSVFRKRRLNCYGCELCKRTAASGLAYA